MNAHIWSRVVAALQATTSSNKRLEETKEQWEEAKSTRDERTKAHDEAERAAAEEHPAKLPDATWKTLQGLYNDRVKAEQAFEVLDRSRRKLVDLVKTLQERVMALNVEAFGEPTLNFDSKSPAWQAVQLADFMGDLLATPFLKAGIKTLADAKVACEEGEVKKAVSKGELTTEQGLYLQSQVIQRLDGFSVEHKLGKARQVEVPDSEKKGSAKPPTAAQVESAAPANAAAAAALAAALAAATPAFVPQPGSALALIAGRAEPIDVLCDHGVADRAVAALKKAGLLKLADLAKPLPDATPGFRGRLTTVAGITPGDEIAVDEALDAIAVPSPKGKAKGKPTATVVKPPRGKGRKAPA